MNTKDDFKNLVTDKIVNTIKKGNLEKWICSFKRLSVPTNAQTKKIYQGQNFLNLSLTAFEANYPTNEWITFNQCNALKGQVKKGEKGTKIIFWEIRKHPETGEKRPIVNLSTVFNKSQTTLEEEPKQILEHLDELRNEIDILNFLEAIPHIHSTTIGRAYYTSEDNSVNMPPAKDFISSGHFYACYFHELTHMTGIETNLDRQCYRDFHFKETARAEEELVAELGSAFLSHQFQIEGDLQQAEYINSWLKVLEMNTDLIYDASIKASQAVNFLNRYSQVKTKQEAN